MLVLTKAFLRGLVQSVARAAMAHAPTHVGPDSVFTSLAGPAVVHAQTTLVQI